MKISELTQISAVRRDIKLPLSIAGQNMSITLGQILDEASQGVVQFNRVKENQQNVTYHAGSATISAGVVLFDLTTNKFYLALGRSTSSAGQVVRSWVYYENWNTHDDFYTEDGEVRADCLFLDDSGRLYRFDGKTLSSAGITDEQAKQIQLSTPIEVNSEEEMEQRISAGECEAGQLYFIAEEE